MINFPNAKINIGLYITKKRIDNFHNIETVMYPIHFQDILEISKSRMHHTSLRILGLKIKGICRRELSPVKAYELLKADYHLPPIDIILYKKIPVGAGLGGGSSNAGHMLKLINNYFKLEINNEKLKYYAKQLGSDDSFFIENTPQLATGRGEILNPISLSLKGYYIVVLYPNIHVSTAESYKRIVPKTPNFTLNQLSELPIEEWKNNIFNDFETSIYTQHPVLKILKEELYKTGAIYASLSGSGSATYGIYTKKPELPHAIKKWVCFEGIIKQ